MMFSSLVRASTIQYKLLRLRVRQSFGLIRPRDPEDMINYDMRPAPWIITAPHLPYEEGVAAREEECARMNSFLCPVIPPRPPGPEIDWDQNRTYQSERERICTAFLAKSALGVKRNPDGSPKLDYGPKLPKYSLFVGSELDFEYLNFDRILLMTLIEPMLQNAEQVFLNEHYLDVEFNTGFRSFIHLDKHYLNI